MHEGNSAFTFFRVFKPEKWAIEKKKGHFREMQSKVVFGAFTFFIFLLPYFNGG
jgi:hypothetical protein